MTQLSLGIGGKILSIELFMEKQSLFMYLVSSNDKWQLLTLGFLAALGRIKLDNPFCKENMQACKSEAQVPLVGQVLGLHHQ